MIIIAIAEQQLLTKGPEISIPRGPTDTLAQCLALPKVLPAARTLLGAHRLHAKKTEPTESQLKRLQLSSVRSEIFQHSRKDDSIMLVALEKQSSLLI